MLLSTNNLLPSLVRNLCGTLMLLLSAVLCVLLFSGTAQAAISIIRTSAPDLYINSAPNPKPVGNYASYQIVSTSNESDVWVRIENFTGAAVNLATHETGMVHIGPMTAGVPKMAYFYLMGAAETATAQTHDIKIYDRLPTAPGAVSLGTQNFTLSSVRETIQANPNQVNALVAGPNPATLGGIMTITVTGDTGTIGSAPGPNGPLIFTPAAYADWRADAYQLIATTITLSGGNTGTYYDTLYLPSLDSQSTTSYVAVYTFRAITVTTAPTAVSPVGYIASGTQVKHTTLSGGAYAGAGLEPIQPATNTLTIGKTVSAATLPNSGGIVTYTLRLTNTSANYTAYLDDIADTLPAATVYLPASSTFNGVIIGDPVASGSTITWYRLFTIPPSSFRDLTFQATLPAVSGTYTNTAVGHVGLSTVIDTTIATTDYAPASATTLVLAPPVIGKGFVPTSIGPSGVSTLTLTINNPNSTTALSGVGFSDLFPTTPDAMTLASTATNNTCGGTLTDQAGNPLATGSAGVKLAGGGIAAGGSCSITLSVTAATAGSYTNTTGAVSSTNAGTGGTAGAALTVSNKPSITAAFSPAAIASGGTSTLTLTIDNNLASPISGVTFTNTFPLVPGAMTAAAPLVTANTCGGTLTDDTGGSLAAGSTGIRLNDGSLAASGSCTVTIAVTATASGTHANSSGGVASNETGTAGTVSNAALLTVLTPPLIAKAFSPAVVAKNSPSMLTVTLTNPNTVGDLTGVGFSDIFPTSPGAMVLSSSATTNTCGGALTDDAGNPLAAGSTSLKLAGGIIAAGGSCTITVPVQAPAEGTYANITGNVTATNGGSGGSAAANLLIDLQPSFSKAFGLNPILARAPSTLTFTITNNSAVALTDIAFTDIFPTQPGQMSLASVASSNTCGGTLTNHTGGALAVGSVGIRLSGGGIATPGASCQIAVAVTALIGGRFDNSTSTLTSSAPIANPATASLNIYTLNKLFGPNPILPSGTSTLTLTVTNPDPGSAISGVAFSDIFPTTPAQMILANATSSNTCGGSLTNNGGSLLAAGSTSLKLTGGSVGANGSCVIQTTVQADTPTTGSYTNTAGINSTDILVLAYSPTATKAFSPETIALNEPSTMTIVLTNNTALGTLTNVSFTDTFPDGLVVAPTPALTNSCGGAIAGGTAGAGYLHLSGGTIPTGAAGSCTITVAVTSAVGGTYANSTSGVSSTKTPTEGPKSNTATLRVQMPAPAVSKSFSPAAISLNGASQLTIALGNANAVNIIDVAFVDTYPAGMSNVAAGTVVEANTCGGLVTAANGGTALSLSGGAIPPAGCAVTVNVVGTALGELVNNTGPVTSTNAASHGGASATLSVAFPPPSLMVLKSASHSVSGDPITSAAPGQVINYTVQVFNTGAGPATNVVLNDRMSPYTAWQLDFDNVAPLDEPFSFAPGTSGLSIDTSIFSLDDGANWDATPVSGNGSMPAGYDGTITNWKIEMAGEMVSGGSFILRYRAMVK